MATGPLLLMARILLAAMFLSSGYAALLDIAATANYFAGLAMPAPQVLAWGIGLFELAAGVLLVLGFQARAVAAILAAFSIVATILGHYGQGGGDATLAFMHSQLLLKDIAVAGGLIVLAIHGPGPISVDGRRQ